MNSLQDDLLNLAEAQAQDLYGCGLDRLDPDNLEELASDLAHEAWFAN
jgi:hypothetical protein